MGKLHTGIIKSRLGLVMLAYWQINHKKLFASGQARSQLNEYYNHPGHNSAEMDDTPLGTFVGNGKRCQFDAPMRCVNNRANGN
jgi:hypothetical protein